MSSRLFVSVLLTLCALFTSALHAAPKVEPWPLWEAHDNANNSDIAHDVWDRWLTRNVVVGGDGINRVRYGSISASDKTALADYLTRMQNLPISKYSRSEQRAYWINVYNAATIKVVLDKYPINSIKDIKLGGFFGAGGPWNAKLLKIQGQDLTLNDVEHRILRPIWKDPRTHYAVNCASLGCPNLANRSYTGARTDVMLDIAAKAFVNHPRGARVNGGSLEVSSIYEWFKADFGGTDAAVIAHLKRFANPSLATSLAGISKISGDSYDWGINVAP